MRTFLGIIGSILMFFGMISAAAVWIWSLYFAYLTSFLALILTVAIPFFSQIYWFFKVWGWPDVHYYNLLCIAVAIFYGLGIFFEALGKNR